jgi:predicted dehydrogenase
MTASFKLAAFGSGGDGWELRMAALARDSGRSASVKVAAVADSNLERAQASARVLGVPAFGSLAEMIARVELDGVVVMSPAEAQCAATVYALQHGLHVLCEAPFGRSAAEAEQMIEAAELVNRVLASGYHYPLQIAWPLWLDSLARVGTPHVIEARWQRPAGVANLGSHLLSVALLLHGSRPTAVRWNLLDGDRNPHWAEDEFSVTVDFADGARGKFTAVSRADVRGDSFDVRCEGPEGQVRVPLIGPELDAGALSAQVRPEETALFQQWNWIAACLDERPLSLGPQEAVLVHRVLAAAHRSYQRWGGRSRI